MRAIPTVLSMILFATPALAGASESIDLAKVPERCRSVSDVPTSARIAEPAFSARVSAASCLDENALAETPLGGDDASIQRLNAITAPIIATLDEVIARGDASEQLVAEYTKGDLLLGLQTRMRDAIPRMTPRSSLADAQDIERRHRALEPKLAPWGREATDAFRRVVQIARANPNIATGNSVIQYMEHAAEHLEEQ